MLRNENRMTSYSTDIDRNVTMLKQLNIKKNKELYQQNYLFWLWHYVLNLCENWFVRPLPFGYLFTSPYTHKNALSVNFYADYSQYFFLCIFLATRILLMLVFIIQPSNPKMKIKKTRNIFAKLRDLHNSWICMLINSVILLKFVVCCFSREFLTRDFFIINKHILQ